MFAAAAPFRRLKTDTHVFPLLFLFFVAGSLHRGSVGWWVCVCERGEECVQVWVWVLVWNWKWYGNRRRSCKVPTKRNKLHMRWHIAPSSLCSFSHRRLCIGMRECESDDTKVCVLHIFIGGIYMLCAWIIDKTNTLESSHMNTMIVTHRRRRGSLKQQMASHCFQQVEVIDALPVIE